MTLSTGGGDPNGINSVSTKASQVQANSGSQATKSSETIATNVLDTMHKWIENMKSQTEIDYKSRYGDKWNEFLQEDQLRRTERARKEEQKQKGRDEILARCNTLRPMIPSLAGIFGRVDSRARDISAAFYLDGCRWPLRILKRTVKYYYD